MIACLVLAAGLGTRLRPLTDLAPKALVPIGDASALKHAVVALRKAGVTNIAANAHHRKNEVQNACSALGIACSLEDDLLGTAGGLARAKSILGAGDVLVWNADIFAPTLDVTSLVAQHRARRATAEATLLVRPCALGAGNVGWNDEGRIVRLRKETTSAGELSSGEFLGIHVVGAKLALPVSGCLVGDVYLPALRAGAQLHVWCTDIIAHDIGSLASYRTANMAWLAARGAESFVAGGVNGARVDSRADISGSVILEGAVVNANAKESVVWPNAIVNEPIFQAIATPAGISTAA